MTPQRLILLAGAILAIVGIIFLLVSPSVSGDRGEVSCGTPIAGGDLSAARAADNQSLGNQAGDIPVVGPMIKENLPQTQSHVYEANCKSAIKSRLSWAIPVTVVGVLIAGGASFVGGRGVRSARG